MIIKPKSSVRKDGRTDSLDSSSSYSSIQERIPDFDPDTYVITTKPPSVSSRGLRSDSSDSGQSLSSYSSFVEQPRYDEESSKSLSKNYIAGDKNSGHLHEIDKPRRMIININGKMKGSESEKDARGKDGAKDCETIETGGMKQGAEDGTMHVEYSNSAILKVKLSNRPAREDENSEKMPAPLADLQKMMNMIQNDDVFTDDVEKENVKHAVKYKINSNESELLGREKTETSKLRALKLEELNSEEMEVFTENNEQKMNFGDISSPIQSRIQIKSGKNTFF